MSASGCGSGTPSTNTSKPSPRSSSPVDIASSAGTKHYAIGTSHNESLAISLGFDVLDIAGSKSDPNTTKEIVDALPAGVQALISVTNLDKQNCSAPGYTTARFEALVNAMATDPNVYGYYIADEPHPMKCPNAAADIRARADYLHAHSSFQKAFIVIVDGDGNCESDLGCEYRALRPANTHVDLVGLDPYPCHYNDAGDRVACHYSMIDQRVASATASGIPLGMIVPVFQAFGQEGRVNGTVYYRTPSPSELTTILSTWHRLVPKPVMDYAYTFGIQCSTSCPAPQALLNHPDLQSLIEAHNR